MNTKISMNMPEALDALDTEITAVAVLTDGEYEALLNDGKLPDHYRPWLQKFTKVQTSTPTSSLITGYKAVLCCTETGAHGIAVCGRNTIHSAGFLSNGTELIRNRINNMADYICDLARVPGRKKDTLDYSLNKLSHLFKTNVTADNGVGELLAAELKSRDEITDVILNEDCLEMNLALNYGQEALDTPGEWMNLAGLIGCNLHDVHLLHDSEEHDLATIVDLTPGTLTEQGKQDWADVLAAKVENISHGYYGTQIDLSGCDAERIRDFSYMLAGQCSVSDYDKWVRDGSLHESQPEETDAPDESESSGMVLQ